MLWGGGGVKTPSIWHAIIQNDKEKLTIQQNSQHHQTAASKTTEKTGNPSFCLKLKPRR